MANWWEQDTSASSNTDWWAKDESAPGTILRGLNYGPIVGEHTRDTMFGPVGNALENQDVALSPNVGYPLGTSLDVYNPKSGEFLGTHRVADASYYHPNQPTRNTIELRDKMVDGPLFVTPHSGGENWWKNDAPAQAQAPSPDAIPTYAAQQVSPGQPEGSVLTDPQARTDLVANVKQGLKDFIPTLRQGVATTAPRNREELVSALQDVTQKAAAPYEESMYRTVGPEKYDQPALDLSSPYAMVPGIPPGLIPELAKIQGPVGDYIRSQVEATPKHEPSGYERFGQAALAAASQLTTPHSAADIYSFKTPGAQQAFAAERLLSTPEQAAKVKQTYQDQGLPEAAATGLNEAIMDILPALHDAGKLKEAAQYNDLIPTPEAKPSIDQAPGEVYFQPGDAEATAQRTQAAGQQISPEHLQAIAQALQRQDTGLPTLNGEAGSPNYLIENAIEKALRRTTPTPLRSAADLALTPRENSVPQLDEKSNDASITPDVQRPSEVPLKPEKEPNQGAETDLAPAGLENSGAVERQNGSPVGSPARMERPGQPEAGAQTGQAPGAETLAGQINTETGRADRGLDPREEVLRREFGKSVELAQKKEANNPGAGRRLVDRLEKSPKAVNDPDHVLLAQQVIQAQNEYDQAAKEVAANPNDAGAKHAADIADERIQKAYQAYDNAGTGTARGLAIRNVLKAHDYTLPAMQARFRTKVGDLTPRQAAEIKGIHDRMAAADETLGNAYAGLDPKDAKKLVRLYRVEPKDLGDRGDFLKKHLTEAQWQKFTSERGRAFADQARQEYGAGSKEHSTYYVDVPKDVAESAKRMNVAGKEPFPEYLLPPEYVARKQLLTSEKDVLSSKAGSSTESRRAASSERPAENGRMESGSGSSVPPTGETKLYAGLDPEDIAKRLGRDVKRISKDTADYQARTEAKDITPRKPKGEPLMSAEKQKALYEREKAKADYHSMIERVKYEQKSPLYRGAAQLLSYPRRLAVAGHGIVFPITHAGDLLLRSASWGTFGKGFLRTYAATASKGFHDASMGRMMDSKFKNGENAFHLATASKVDVGIGIGGAGLVKGEGMAGRAWDALKVMRFELWKNQMEKVMRKNPGLSYAEKLEAGKELASWANHATGSGKGLLADSKAGQAILFGPKLTQSKLNKLSIDPAKTIATFANWKNATLGERTAAKVRLSGAAQYATTLAGFLIGNAAILQAMGSKQKINLTDPNKTDFWSFKIAGTDVAIPGLHSEMRYLAQILATTVASRKDLRGESRQGAIFDKGSQYLRSKLSPTAQLVAEGATSQDYRGRPLPWSNEKPTKFLPKYSPTEYAASKAPIPLTGPGKYVFDQMRDKGMSATDAAQTTQALTIFGLGLTGMHVHEDYPEKPKKGH